ncbi:MAG: uroporphyrinogen decarboxylase family protein [candidate division KSB1 bacterium]|jgi:uroporphyrinogen decarboxylase|nr:uroporphyrinogen decarboxylase family protein [candidate division KSB1 bacterium]
MNSKERVHAAIARQETDRVPVFMWFHPDTAKILSRILEIPEASIGDAFGNDVRQAWVANNYAMEGIVHEHDGESHRDEWGIEWVKYGPFNQIKYSPLQNADEEAIAAYRYPYKSIEKLLGNMDAVTPYADDYFIGCDISPCLFELLSRLRGMEESLLDIAMNPGLAKRMLEDAAQFAIRIGTMACERFPLDWFWTGDDIGGQGGMILSPQSWRELVKPHLGDIFKVGKKFNLWVAYHSCGGIRPIIPDLIELGLDVLNPIQSTCPGMDARELKEEYGADLTFMGGVDTQDLLPNGSADDVRRETGKLLEIMADGGGYILAASHTIPPETPLENIFAMYEVAGISREEIEDRAGDIRQANARKDNK